MIDPAWGQLFLNESDEVVQRLWSGSTNTERADRHHRIQITAGPGVHLHRHSYQDQKPSRAAVPQLARYVLDFHARTLAKNHAQSNGANEMVQATSPPGTQAT